MEMQPNQMNQHEQKRRKERLDVGNCICAVLGLLTFIGALMTFTEVCLKLFLPLVLITFVLLPAVSRSERMTGTAGLKIQKWIWRFLAFSGFGILLTGTVLIAGDFSRNDKLYPVKRYLFENYVINSAKRNSEPLPKQLPAVHDNYYFYTDAPQWSRETPPRQAFLCIHTDDATIQAYEEKLGIGQPNLACTEEELEKHRAQYSGQSESDMVNLQNETQLFPNCMYRILLKSGAVQEDLSHAVYYPNALINKETGLLILWR